MDIGRWVGWIGNMNLPVSAMLQVWLKLGRFNIFQINLTKSLECKIVLALKKSDEKNPKFCDKQV